MTLFDDMQKWANGIVTGIQTDIQNLLNAGATINDARVQQLQKRSDKFTNLFGGSTSWTEEDIFALAVVFGILASRKGKEVYQTIEPLLKDIIQMDADAMTAMFHATAAQPALAIPAILLFTSINERLLLIDHGSAMTAYGSTAAFMGVSEIGDLFKEGVTSIGFSSPRFVPSGASQPRLPSTKSSAGKGTEVSEGEAGHTRGS